MARKAGRREELPRDAGRRDGRRLPPQAATLPRPRASFPAPRASRPARRTVVLAVLGFIILGLAAWLYALPYLTALRLKSALERNDARALSQEIDFEALRSNLKVRLNTFLTKEPAPTLMGRILGATGSYLSGSVANRVVDADVTPTGLRWLILGKGLAQTGASFSNGSSSGELGRVFDTATCGYQSSTSFVITLHLATGRETTLFFRRSGLTWRLTDIILATPEH